MIGTGRPLVRRRRPYLVKATCNVRLGFWARDPEDAEDQLTSIWTACRAAILK